MFFRTQTSFAVLLTACSSATTFDSGLDENKILSDLSEPEVETLCEESRRASGAFVDQNREGVCGFWAIFGAFVAQETGGAMAACTATRDACLAAQGPIGLRECELPEAGECIATIQELETCYNDLLPPSQEAFTAYARSCESLLSEEVETLDFEPPASCLVVQEKCSRLDVTPLGIGAD